MRRLTRKISGRDNATGNLSFEAMVEYTACGGPREQGAPHEVERLRTVGT
jgi:hypothetical protein